MKLQLQETKKLFWDRYLFRISVFNGLSYIFRSKKLDYAREILDQLQTLYDNDQPLVISSNLRNKHITEQDFVNAKALLKELLKYKGDYLLRVENPILNIYSNDEHWMLSLIPTKINVTEYSRPADEISQDLLSKNIIITNDLVEYEYKITLGDRIGNGSNFRNWIENNKDKIKIGAVCLKAIEDNAYCRGYYFYVRSEKIIPLINIILGNGIQRIDKIVCRANIDK